MSPAARQSATRDATFHLFDSLRGIAALMVLFVHAIYQFAVTRPDVDPGWYRFAVHLDVAVPIFFAISGFLLYRPFISARVKGRPFSIKQYAIRRALRIIPAYWVALVVIVHWFDIEDVKSLWGWLWYGGFLQIYDRDTILDGLGQAWTLDIEVVFYAFLPLWVLAVNWFLTRTGAPRFRTEALGMCLLIVAAWAWNAVTLMLVDVANLSSSAISWVRMPPIQLDHLGAGMLLAVLSVWVAEARRKGETPPGRRLIKLVEEKPWIAWGGALFFWLVACYLGRSGGRTAYQYTDRQFFAEHVIYTPFVFLLLAPAVFGDERRDPIRRLLAWRPLAWVGVISFSFYLWHYSTVGQQAIWWGRLPDGILEWLFWFATALAGTMLIASVSFLLIERPFMNLRYRTGGKAPREAEAAQARAAP